jgi:hypothetical protein
MEDNRNYENSSIYMIEPTCVYDEGDIYYGSTIQKYITTRFGGHKKSYKQWLNGNKSFTSSYLLFEKYGVDNCKIVLVETFSCKSKYELQAREAVFIRNNNCINKVIPTRTQKEYRQDNADKINEHNKEYYENNKNNILENADKIKECTKQYHQNKKEI